MKNKYEGIDEFEGYILETNIPKKKWEYGSVVEFKLYQPERLSEKTPKEYCGILPDFPTSIKSTQYPDG